MTIRVLVDGREVLGYVTRRGSIAIVRFELNGERELVLRPWAMVLQVHQAGRAIVV